MNFGLQNELTALSRSFSCRAPISSYFATQNCLAPLIVYIRISYFGRREGQPHQHCLKCMSSFIFPPRHSSGGFAFLHYVGSSMGVAGCLHSAGKACGSICTVLEFLPYCIWNVFGPCVFYFDARDIFKKILCIYF